MTKINHQEALKEHWIQYIMQQIWDNYQLTGNLDPYSAKMPDVSVKFKNIFEDIDENTYLYRFFSFDKFEDMIKNESLTFVSPLLYDEDTKEVECFDEYKLYVYRQLKYLYENEKLDFFKAGIKRTNIKEIDLMSISSRWEKIFQYCRRNVFVSCWTFNDYNNKFMWNEYTKNSQDAVCIETTVKSLKNAIFKTGHGDHYLDRIKYIDWQQQTIEKNASNDIRTLNALHYSLFHKQKKFKNDNEFRIVIDNLTCNTTPWVIDNVNSVIGHKDFDYDQYFCSDSHPRKVLKERIIVDDLINRIILSPFSTNSSTEKIYKLIEKTNITSKEVIKLPL